MPCNGGACTGFCCGTFSAIVGLCAFGAIGTLSEIATHFEEWVTRIDGAAAATVDITTQEADEARCIQTKSCTFEAKDWMTDWKGQGYFCFYDSSTAGSHRYTCPCEDAFFDRGAIEILVTPLGYAGAALPTSSGDCVWVRDINMNDGGEDEDMELDYNAAGNVAFYTFGDADIDGFYWLGYDQEDSSQFVKGLQDFFSTIVAACGAIGAILSLSACCCCGCGAFFCMKKPAGQPMQPMGAQPGQPGYGGQPVQPAGYGQQPYGQSTLVQGTVVGAPQQPIAYGTVQT